jgi:nitrite reductase/ring-hydroxylating ferredoxin subunit
MKHTLKYLTPALLIVLLLNGTSCKKETTCNGVPNVSVYFQLDLNLGYPSLVPVGNNQIFTGGNGGVIVYHFTSSQFNSYDCTCPYDGSNSKARITATQGGLYGICPVCGSSFLLSSGSPNKGPSTCPLKPYTTNYDPPSNTVTVQN